MASVVGLLAVALYTAPGELAAQSSSEGTEGAPAAMRGESTSLSLDEAVERALEFGEEVALVREQIAQAEEEITQVRSGALPQVSGNLTDTRQIRSILDALSDAGTLPPGNGNGMDEGEDPFADLPFGRPNTWIATLSVSQTLYAAGQVSIGLDIAERVRALLRSELELTTALEAELRDVDRRALEAAVLDRPSLQAAEAQIRIGEDQVRLARSGYRPTASAFAEVGYQSFPRTVFPDSDWREDWNVGVQISVPIFNGFRTAAEVEQARSEVRQSELERQQAEDGLLLEFDGAVGDFDAALSQVTARRTTVEQADRGDLESWRQFSDTVTGEREAVLRARSDDEIREIRADVGDRVTMGQTLVRQAGQGSDARIRQAQAGVQQADRAVERLRPLWEAGARSDQDWDDANTQLELAEADLESAAEVQGGIAPISGVISEVPARVGSFPQPGDPLVRVVDDSAYRVPLRISEGQARELERGMSARVAAYDATGELDRIAIQASAVTRLVEVEARFPGSSSLRPGALVTVGILVAAAEDVVRVPRQALRAGAVWVVSGDEAEFREVEVGLRNEEMVEIVSGLDAGEAVVVEGASLLSDGARVQVVD